jgi:hypothetical protein
MTAINWRLYVLIHRQEDPQAAEEARSSILADDCLSFAAQGLLLKILEHAPEWNTNAAGISKAVKDARGQRGEGVAAVRALFQEMAAAGYLVRTIVPRGNLRGTRVDVFDVPQPLAPLTPAPPIDHPIERRGTVTYLVGQPGNSTVKIGQTGDIRKRLAGLQTASPMRLEVLWSHHGGFYLEQLLHHQFERYRLHGEWFNFGRSDPVKAVSRFVRQVDDKKYEEFERQLKEYGCIVDDSLVWPYRAEATQATANSPR